MLHTQQPFSSTPQQSFTFSSNSFSNKSSKLPSFLNHSNSQNTSEISPSLLLRNKFAHFNNQLLLPRCLQKSVTKKFTLSPLTQLNLKSQSAFKLKNYFKPQQRPFQQPIFADGDQENYSHVKSQNHKYQTSLNLLRQNASQQENKQNLNYQNQLAQMMITKSKFKYSPRDTLRMTQTKWSQQSNKNTHQTQQIAENSIISTNNTMINFNQFSFKNRKRFSSNNLHKDLLNSTRSKLFCQMQKIPIQKITKKDIFPLERLMEKKAHKTSFRNKWFTAKTLENQVTEE